MVYIATFYSHFGAIRFKKEYVGKIEKAKLMPVPRDLSSSCGTCVGFEADESFTFTEDPRGEIEQVVRSTDNGYVVLFKAKEN